MSAKKASKTVEKQIYIGPTISGIATHNTIFNNGIPAELEKAMESEKAFKNLVVPLSSLAQAKKEIESKSGSTYIFYKKVENYKK